MKQWNTDNAFWSYFAVWASKRYDPSTGKLYRPGSIDDPKVIVGAAEESRRGREYIFGRYC